MNQIVTAALLLALLLTGCSSDPPSAPEGTTPPPPEIFIECSAADRVYDDQPMPLEFRAGFVSAEADSVGTAGMRYLIEVDGGTVRNREGRTGESGRVRTVVDLDYGTPSAEIRLHIFDEDGNFERLTLDVQVDARLMRLRGLARWSRAEAFVALRHADGTASTSVDSLSSRGFGTWSGVVEVEEEYRTVSGAARESFFSEILTHPETGMLERIEARGSGITRAAAANGDECTTWFQLDEHIRCEVVDDPVDLMLRVEVDGDPHIEQSGFSIESSDGIERYWIYNDSTIRIWDVTLQPGEYVIRLFGSAVRRRHNYDGRGSFFFSVTPSRTSPGSLSSPDRESRTSRRSS